jgi:hypothetical protein
LRRSSADEREVSVNEEPLLRKLAVHYRRPQIEHPDLVILNSGYWDLRRYTEL